MTKTQVIKQLWTTVESMVKSLKDLDPEPTRRVRKEIWNDLLEYKLKAIKGLECLHEGWVRYSEYDKSQYALLKYKDVIYDPEDGECQVCFETVYATVSRIRYKDIGESETTLSAAQVEDMTPVTEPTPDELIQFVSAPIKGLLFEKLLKKG